MFRIIFVCVESLKKNYKVWEEWGGKMLENKTNYFKM